MRSSRRFCRDRLNDRRREGGVILANKYKYKPMIKKLHLCLAVAIAAGSTTYLAAQTEATQIDELRQQVRTLEQQLGAVSKRLDTADTAPKVVLSDKGFNLSTVDGAYSIKFRGVAQVDSRVFFDDNADIVNTAFVLRRTRIITEGVLAKNFTFLFVPEFGGTSPTILDAAIGLNLTKSLQIKVGKFTPPLGLERLQGVCWGFFNEPSLASNLVPSRDIGVQASGLVANGLINYSVGVYDGVADNAANTNTDFDNDKDAIVRIFATPFKNHNGSVLQGLSVGAAASYGRAKTTSGRTAGYRTDGQQTFFAYNTTTVADGPVWRFIPQLDFRRGSFGAMSEYVISAVTVRSTSGGDTQELRNRSWQCSAGYVLTGEASSFTGVVPRTNFDLAAGTWGAFEATARVANLKVDDKAFPLFASAASNANEATSGSIGLNWYLCKAVMLSADYYQTNFGSNSAAPLTSTNAILRQHERAFITRLQVAF